jgi:hypothetical protein
MAVIKLKTYVANLSNVLSLFDKIQFWRSESGTLGVFFEITAATALPATLLGIQTSPFTLNGKTLKLKVNQGSEQSITVVSADPIGIDDLVSFLNTELVGAFASEDGGALRLTTTVSGTVSVLEITGGTALTDLGFTVGQIDNGEDQRVTLSPSSTLYEYDDQSGDPDNYYKVRYYNSITGTFSSFSDPVKGDIGSIVPPTDLVKAYGTFAKLDGKPQVGIAIIFYNVYMPPLSVGDIGIIGREVRVETDQAGYTETMLVKGSIVDVIISGTGIIRRIRVPTSDFNIMSAVAAADDNFQIQIPDIPAAVRRS